MNHAPSNFVIQNWTGRGSQIKKLKRRWPGASFTWLLYHDSMPDRSLGSHPSPDSSFVQCLQSPRNSLTVSHSQPRLFYTSRRDAETRLANAQSYCQPDKVQGAPEAALVLSDVPETVQGWGEDRTWTTPFTNSGCTREPVVFFPKWYYSCSHDGWIAR